MNDTSAKIANQEKPIKNKSKRHKKKVIPVWPNRSHIF